jgi:hypothetical protein
MEDVDFVFQTVRVSDKLNVSVFGVLDGHGGKECAMFVGDELPMKIAGILRSGSTCPIGLHQSLIDIDKDVRFFYFHSNLHHMILIYFLIYIYFYLNFL